MLEDRHAPFVNSRRFTPPPLLRETIARLPGDVATTPPPVGSTAAVVRTTGAGGVQPCAGACSAVALSTASAVVHAYSATVYGGVHVTSRHAIGPSRPISWWHCPYRK